MSSPPGDFPYYAAYVSGLLTPHKKPRCLRIRASGGGSILLHLLQHCYPHGLRVLRASILLATGYIIRLSYCPLHLDFIFAPFSSGSLGRRATNSIFGPCIGALGLMRQRSIGWSDVQYLPALYGLCMRMLFASRQTAAAARGAVCRRLPRLNAELNLFCRSQIIGVVVLRFRFQFALFPTDKILEARRGVVPAYRMPGELVCIWHNTAV